MLKINLQNSFKEFCEQNKFEVNTEQLKIIDLLIRFFNHKKTILSKFFRKKEKLCFYLHGKVGVGKTMILNFVYERLSIKKNRQHFNEFMINFHDFRHEKKDNNTIRAFVKKLKKKYDLIYLDEFQVTNIVDAMILGKLFEIIFEENIKIIITTNTKLKDLYKDGLQREQFLPFIKILNEHTYEKELIIDEDYRTTNKNDLKRFLFPLNQSTNFRFSKFFRKLTRNKSQSLKVLDIKGRKLKLENFYEGILKLDFEELCNRNLGAEDYIAISKNSNFIFLENLPSFDENNSNQQQRFITFIDIIYEKKIPLMITSEKDLKFIESSKSLKNIFKRTTSRLYELTSQKYD